MSCGLHWVTSNRLESLAERLSLAIRRGPRNPLAAEVLVVQSLGMARWLQLELARRNGVCSRVRFPFPKVFLQEVCHVVVPEAAQERRFSPEALAWRLWSQLSATERSPALAEPIRYAGDDPRRRFQLAHRLAGLFDQYLVYRPDLIARWTAGEDESWQAELWRRVGGDATAWPESRWLLTAMERLRNGPDPWPQLPERVAVFGISALPPIYVEVLSALATTTEVTIYQLLASQEYWGDTVSRREEQRALRRAGRKADEGEALHLERGPRLLTSLGRLGRSFLNLLAEQGAGADEDPEGQMFPDPGSDTLLHAVQSDLLHLTQRGSGVDGPPLLSLRADDDSLRVHACHSPRRELEVLADQLWSALEADPTLAPRDILVLTPDIETYAPLIQALFGSPEEERRRLPFTVADRVPRAESSLADAFLRLLSLPGKRFGRSELLPLFERPAWQRRFGWTPQELPQVRDWLDELQVSWGLNAAQRVAQGLPAFAQGTWRQAADQLMLGQALAPGDEVVMQGISPYLAVEGEGAELAGRFAACVALLEGLPGRLAAERSLPQWADDLTRVLEDFFAPSPESEGDFELVRATLDRLRQAGIAADFTGSVPLAAVVEQLGPWLSEERRAGGFLRGGITFAALKPMRSVPARIIAVLGLNDGAFPRRPNPLSFDLIAAEPRAGDESREADDRYLFLETLLSARDRLHLSYVGRSLRDNADLPPSVVISELLDHLGGGVVGGEAAVRQQVLIRHPLHAFSPEYFGAGTDPRLFSYSQENSVAARVAHQLTQTAESAGPFCPEPLAEPIGPWRETTVVELARFLANPAAYFLERRLGLRLPEMEAAPEDRETFTLDALESFQVKQEWLRRLREGRGPSPLQQRLEVDGTLPLGPASRLTLQDFDLRMQGLLARVTPDELRTLDPLSVQLTLGPYTLRGTLPEVTSVGLRLIRPARFKPADLLRLWLYQLVWTTQNGPGSASARLIAEDESWTVRAPDQARALLTDLLELRAEGLRRPLPFFPRAAWALTGSGRKPAAERALAQWTGNPNQRGEASDPAFEFCFGGVEPHPLNEEFHRLARRICDPLRAVATKEKGRP